MEPKLEKMIKVGVDIDGVLYDWEGEARFLLNWYHGYNLKESDHWDAIKNQVNPKHWDWLWSIGVVDHGLFLHGNPIKGAIEAMAALDSGGIQLNIITNRPTRPSSIVMDTKDWIHFHLIPYFTIDFTTDKANYAEKHSLDIVIDDMPKNILALQAKHIPVVIFDQPWNQGLPGTRVSGWTGVLKHFDINPIKARGI